MLFQLFCFFFFCGFFERCALPWFCELEPGRKQFETTPSRLICRRIFFSIILCETFCLLVECIEMLMPFNCESNTLMPGTFTEQQPKLMSRNNFCYRIPVIFECVCTFYLNQPSCARLGLRSSKIVFVQIPKYKHLISRKAHVCGPTRSFAIQYIFE